MSLPLLRNALFGRHQLLIAAALIFALLRLGLSLSTHEPTATPLGSDGLQLMAWGMLMPIFAAMMGAELLRFWDPSRAFLLTRPIPRGTILRSHHGAALIVIILIMVMILVAMPEWTLLPWHPMLPITAPCLSLSCHGIATLGGSAGRSFLGSVAWGALLSYGSLLMILGVELELGLLSQWLTPPTPSLPAHPSAPILHPHLDTALGIGAVCLLAMAVAAYSRAYALNALSPAHSPS